MPRGRKHTDKQREDSLIAEFLKERIQQNKGMKPYALAVQLHSEYLERFPNRKSTRHSEVNCLYMKIKKIMEGSGMGTKKQKTDTTVPAKQTPPISPSASKLMKVVAKSRHLVFLVDGQVFGFDLQQEVTDFLTKNQITAGFKIFSHLPAAVSVSIKLG